MNKNNINFAICDKCNATYGIFSNGSQIFNLKTGVQIFGQSLASDDIKSCYAIAKKYNLHVHAYSDDQLVSEKLQYLDLRNFKLQKRVGFKFVIVPNVLEYIEKNNLKGIVLSGRPYHVEKNNLPIHQFIISSSSSLGFVENEILENAHVSISKISKFGQYRDRILNKEYEYLSIVPYNTNKSNAIKFLSNYLSIDNTDVMAIGDNLNDVDMVKSSGVGVAVANAYSELKDVAKYTTQNSASDGGFAEAVYRFIEFEK